ncbi:tetratricopeptide repeat protein, partial [bacterium]|nr:tetratricopeptide repeat protein [bacterium]
IFFLYVASYFGWYTARNVYVEESFADWVLSEAPPSSLELLDATRNMARGDALAYLAAQRDFTLDLMIVDEWYTEALRFQSEWREEEQEAVIDAMGVLAEAVDVPRFWDLYWSAKANLHQRREEWSASISCWREAIAAAEPGSVSRAVSHNNLGNVLQSDGQYEEALASYEASLDHYGALQDTLVDPEAAESWRGAGQCLTRLGRTEPAAAALTAAAELFARRGGLMDIQRRCGTFSELGDAYEAVGRYREAIDAWTLELYVAEELDWAATVAAAHDDMSDGFWNLGELQKAVDERLESVRIYTELGADRDLAIANTNLGSIYWQLGDAASARERYQSALAVHEAREEWWDVADVLKRMGKDERQKGNHPRALELLGSALETFARDDWTADAAATELEIAEVYEGMGHPARSDSVYALALADYHRAGDTGGEAKVLEWWGYSLIGRKETAAARDKLETALALSEAAGNLGGQADIWRVLSNLYTGLDGDHEAGIAAAGRSLEIARSMPSKQHEAQALTMLATGLFNAGRIDDAFARMRAALDLFRETGDQAGIADSQTALGRLHAARGDYDEAVAAYSEAMAVAEAADLQGSVAGILSAMAWLQHLYGEEEIAFQTAKDAYDIYKEQDNDWALADLYNTLGSARGGQGLYEDSLGLYRLSLEIREAWGDPYGMAASHNNMGDVYRQLGDCETAVEHFREALEIGERIGYVDVMTITAGNLARCYHELGRTDEALDLIDRGLELARSVGVPPRIIDMHIFRADLLFELDELDEAATAIREGLTIAAPMGTTVATMKMGAKLGAVDWKRGRHAEAESRLREVIPQLREMRNPILLWEPLFYLGRIQRDRGEPEPAVDAFREAIDTLEQVRQGIEDEDVASGFQEKHGDVYRELVDVLMELGREEEAWEILGLMKSSEAREMGAGGPRLNDDDQALVDEAAGLRSHETRLVRLLREELARPVEQQRPELVTVWQTEIDSLKLHFHDFTRSLRRDHPQAYERLEVEPVSFNQLRRGLLVTEAFVEPVVLPDRIVVFVVRGDEDPLIYREVPVAQARVDELIREMRAGLEHPDDDWETARTARLAGMPAPPAERIDPSIPARELHALLIDPLAGDLIGVETLIVSPSGRLRYIPFAALYDGERYLLERYRLCVLTQAGTLTSRRPVPTDAALLAFGNPDSTLAGAELEVNELEEIWQPAPVTAVYGEDATKARLRDEVGTHNILHLATHGVLLNDRPEAS